MSRKKWGATAAALLVASLFVAAAPANAEGQGPPKFTVMQDQAWTDDEGNSFGDWIQGFGWTPNGQVQVFVNDFSLGHFPVVHNEWGYDVLEALLGSPENPFYFTTGDVVRLVDDTTGISKSFTITNLEVTEFNPGALTGTCDPSLWGGDQGPLGTVTLGNRPSWGGPDDIATSLCKPEGTFDATGVEFTNGPLDFKQGLHLNLSQSDADGDGILLAAFWQPPMFTVEVNDDALYGWGWTPGSTVHVSVDGELIASLLVDDGMSIWHEFNGNWDGPPIYDFQTGDVVKVQDANTPAIFKELVLTPLEVTALDAVADTMSGICTPDVGDVTISDWNAGVSLSCDETGTFAGTFDIVGWMYGNANQTDEDGDQVSWSWYPPVTTLRADGNKTFAAGGSTTLTFRLVSDVEGYCNVDADHPATFLLGTWDPDGAPVGYSSSSLTFAECGVGQTVTFSSDVAGTYRAFPAPDWDTYVWGAQFYPEEFELLVTSAAYDFSGFFSPVDGLPTANTVKAGQAVPVKFSLGGDFGLDIITVNSASMACDTGDLDAVEETVTAGGSSLSYDALTDTYTYVWKTNKAWGGTCRQLNVTLDDGTYQLANFKFKR